jgi:hypothetical protein
MAVGCKSAEGHNGMLKRRFFVKKKYYEYV